MARRGRSQSASKADRLAILVALIGAGGAVAAATIGLIKPSDPIERLDPPKAHVAVPAARTAFPHITSVSISWTPDSRYVVVTGNISALLDNTQALYAVAAPVNGEPVGPTPGATAAGLVVPTGPYGGVRRWYVSPPVNLRANGSWEARIDIDPTETRQLAVRAFVITACDVPPLAGTSCMIPPMSSPTTPNSIPGPPPIPRDRDALANAKNWLEVYGPPDAATKSDPATIGMPHS
jgi:hypothetical protein